MFENFKRIFKNLEKKRVKLPLKNFLVKSFHYFWKKVYYYAQKFQKKANSTRIQIWFSSKIQITSKKRAKSPLLILKKSLSYPKISKFKFVFVLKFKKNLEKRRKNSVKQFFLEFLYVSSIQIFFPKSTFSRVKKSSSEEYPNFSLVIHRRGKKESRLSRQLFKIERSDAQDRFSPDQLPTFSTSLSLRPAKSSLATCASENSSVFSFSRVLRATGLCVFVCVRADQKKSQKSSFFSHKNPIHTVFFSKKEKKIFFQISVIFWKKNRELWEQRRRNLVSDQNWNFLLRKSEAGVIFDESTTP